MPQIYDTPQGPALLVRQEDRGAGLEYLFAVVNPQQRMIGTVWSEKIPDEYVLINDPEARAEANVFAVENEALIREKTILLECLTSALAMLDERSSEQIRDIYRAKIKTAGVVSLTKASDLIGVSTGD